MNVPAIYVWLLVIFLIAGFSIYAMQLAAKVDDETGDTGPAILEFGKAFPQEAIRDVVATADDNAVFLRLFEGKVGCVQFHRRTVSCQLLKPGSVAVLPSERANTIRIDFRNSRSDSGEFTFRSARQAAEVSLWLLGSFSGGAPASETLSPA